MLQYMFIRFASTFLTDFYRVILMQVGEVITIYNISITQELFGSAATTELKGGFFFILSNNETETKGVQINFCPTLTEKLTFG
jgi:hypothetical protein